MTKKNKRQPGTGTLSARQSVSDAFALILTGQLEELERRQNAARTWDSIEGVHKMRVALRRMRCALRTFRPAIARSVSQPWSDEMRWLARQLGPARDLDVFISEGLDRVADRLPLEGQTKLRLLALRRREQAYQTVVDTLDSERFGLFKRDFGAWLKNRAWFGDNALSAKQHQRSQANVVLFARDSLDRQERRVLIRGSGIDRSSPVAMHDLRIECKRLRYTAEWFEPVFGNMDRYIAHVKALQDLLGVMSDVDAMQSLLRSLLARRRDRELLQYAGGLVGWRVRQYQESEGEFPERWRSFVSETRPWWQGPA